MDINIGREKSDKYKLEYSLFQNDWCILQYIPYALIYAMLWINIVLVVRYVGIYPYTYVVITNKY